MADTFDTVGDWVNDAREWFSERLAIGDWVEGFEDWLKAEAETVFTWISVKLRWLVDTLQAAMIDGEPPLVALFFVFIALAFGLRALGSPVSAVRAVLMALVALPIVLWAHDGETQVALVAATVALLALIGRDQQEPLNPFVLTAVVSGPAAAIVLRGNRLIDDPPVPVVVLAVLAAVGVVVLFWAAHQRGALTREIAVAGAATASVVAAVLTDGVVGAVVAVAAAAVAVVLWAVEWVGEGTAPGYPLDGLMFALFTGALYFWGDLEIMAGISAGLLLLLVIPLAVVRPVAGRPFPMRHVMRGMAAMVVGAVVVAGLAGLSRLIYDNVGGGYDSIGDGGFRLEVLRPLAATWELWTDTEFLLTAVAVVAGVVLVALLVMVLGVASLHAVALSGLAVAGFLLDDPLYMVIALAALAWEVRSFQFALVAGIGFFIIDVMGLWSQAMETLSLVMVATLLAVSIGVPIGIGITRSGTASRVVRPVLDFMQTMPAFVYLIPAVGFFRLGAVPGVVATVIFAMPPAVRLTELGIRQVDHEVVEAGEAFGTPPSRILSRIQIPLAMPTIMAGVNQVIMLALSMVVIAALVGAAGLGTEVVRGVSRQDTSVGFQAGLGVVILAIYLDRVTQALGDMSGTRASRSDAS